MKSTLLTIAGLAVFLCAEAARAGDSPQFRGPHRDGRFDEQGLLKAWPESGPPQLWVAKGLGQGYASVSVAGGKIYVPGMMEDQNGYISVLGLDGAVEKKILYGPETQDKQAPGPRSTPTLDGERLYLLSGLGVAYCIDMTQGTTKWEVNILERFKGEMTEWTLAESLLVDGDRVICTPGGPDAGVAALDKLSGETVWATKGLSDQASYCSPALIVHNNRRMILTETAKLVVGIDADTGALLWTHEHPTEYDIHAVTPLYDKGLVYFTGGYGSGGGALELAPDGASVTLKWEDKTLDCQHHGVVLDNGYLYGTGHKTKKLVCLEMATGKLMWATEEIRQGAVVYTDDMLYVYEGPRTGVVSLVKPSPDGFESAGSFKVTEGGGNHWAHPVIAGGCLYIRHGDALIAYNLKTS